MCGILGVYSKNKLIDNSVINTAVKSLSHRGPDGSGYDLIEKKAGLPTAIWIRAGHDGTGTLMQFNSIIKGLRWKLVQDILICKGNWNEKFIDQCTELSLGLAIGLETNIY